MSTMITPNGVVEITQPCQVIACHGPATVVMHANGPGPASYAVFACDDEEHQHGLRRQLAETSSSVIVTTRLARPAAEPIIYLSAGSRDLQNLSEAASWAVTEGRHFRITIDDGTLKFKPGELSWSPGIQSHRPDGGY